MHRQPKKKRNSPTKVSRAVTGNRAQYSCRTCYNMLNMLAENFAWRVMRKNIKSIFSECCYLSPSMMCPDKVQTLYTVPLFWSGEGACSWPKNTARDKRSDMINTAFVLAILRVITQNVHVIHPFSLADISLVSIKFDFFICSGCTHLTLDQYPFCHFI